jgi:hypothetical protein
MRGDARTPRIRHKQAPLPLSVLGLAPDVARQHQNIAVYLAVNLGRLQPGHSLPRVANVLRSRSTTDTSSSAS